MPRATLAEAVAEMRRDQWHDFCVNESARISRFAGRLADAGQRERAQQMFDIADMLGKMAHQGAAA